MAKLIASIPIAGSNAGNTYVVEIFDDKSKTCSCKSYKFCRTYPKECKHTKLIKDIIDAEANAV